MDVLAASSWIMCVEFVNLNVRQLCVWRGQQQQRLLHLTT
jgi:hypothetical protein